MPTLLLFNIMSASFALLYSLEELHNPEITVKVIGHQWYWTYEITHVDNYTSAFERTCSAYYSVEFDSYLLPVDELLTGSLRLLDVDKMISVTSGVQIRLNFTSTDVIHS